MIFLLAYILYCVMMGFNTKIESVIGRRIPVPQSWREVEQSHANRGVMVGGGSEAGTAASAADEAKYKSMAKKAADAGGGGGFVAMECKPHFIYGHFIGGFQANFPRLL